MAFFLDGLHEVCCSEYTYFSSAIVSLHYIEVIVKKPRMMICSSQLLSSPILILQTNNTSIRLQAYLFFLRQDLNRIKKKPYTETVDSDGRSDEVSRMKKHGGLNVTLCLHCATSWFMVKSHFVQPGVDALVPLLMCRLLPLRLCVIVTKF